MHPVRELFRAGATVHEVLLARDEDDAVTAELRELAAAAGVPVRTVERGEVDALTPDIAHQGVVAWAPPFRYADLGDILARDRDEPPLLLGLDHLTDPYNLGSIVRSAEAAGADAVVIPRHRAAGVTAVVEKAAAGALAHLPIVRTANIAHAVRTCRDADLWVLGLESGQQPRHIYESGLLTEPLLVLVGSEGEGLAHLSYDLCDQLVSLPLRGNVESLNAAVAAAIALYEIRRQRDV